MSVERVKADPGWRLDRFDQSGRSAVFIRAPRERVSGSAFLDQRWRSPGDESVEISIQELAAAAPGGPPPVFIFHTAFCCSTLLAGLLDAPGRALPVREPDILMTLANIKRNQGAAAARSVLPAVLSHVGRGYEPAERAVIKPTNLANSILSDCLAARPEAKAIFLTSSLESFLLSVVKKGEAGRAFARMMYTIFAMDGRGPQMSNLELLRLSDLQMAAMVWHMQIAEMQAALEGAGERVAWLDGDAFLRTPEETLTKIDQFLGLGLGEAGVKAAVSGPVMKVNPKSGQPFSAADRAADADRVRTFLGDDLERISQWSRASYPNSHAGELTSPVLASH